MDQAKSSQPLVTAREREYLAKLCWLLNDAGTQALRFTFDSIHPPLVLKDHLVQNHVKAVLARLLDQKVLTSKQWKTLYPQKKKPASSQRYDSKILVILLETICHLCPPYPNGWNASPLQADKSLSSDLVRLQMILQQIGALVGVRHEEYPILWTQMVEVLERLGGPPIRVKIQRIDNETLPLDMQNHYIQLVKDAWGSSDDKSMTRLRQLDGTARRSRLSNASGYNDRNKVKEKEGLSLEDKAVITKMYKLLVDNIIVEDILDRLQQGQIIKIADRQEIMAQPKNPERVQIVLEKILSCKLSYALKLLCDALKFKYPPIYDTVMKCRKAVYKQGVTETVDLVRVCQDALSSHYRNVFCKYCPIPWNDNIHMNVHDYYTPVDIIDEQGKKKHLSDLLPIQNAGGTGKRILLEGCSGCGKSTLAAVLASIWATQKNYFKQKYEFLLYIDAQTIEENFFEDVHKMVLPDNTTIGVKEFWSLLEHNARDLVILIDGFDDTTDCTDLQEIIKGTKFRQCAVVLLVTPEVHVHKYMSPDYKLFNTGLGEGNRMKFFKSYAQLLKLDAERYEIFTDYLANTQWPLLTHLSSPFVCLMLLMVYQGNANLDLSTITSLTSLFEQFSITMATEFCQRQNLECLGSEFPEEVSDTIHDLEELAFDAIILRQTAFDEEELYKNKDNGLITKFGALNRNNPSNKFKFLCSMVIDFLAARHMADMSYEDLSKTISENKLLKASRYAQLISFICGLFREDTDTPTLSMLFQELTTECSHDHLEIVMKDKDDVISRSDDVFSRQTSGHVLNYSHSLHGASECSGRQNVTDIIAPSIAQRLFIRREGMFPQNCILGMSYVLKSDLCNVTQLEINLLPVYVYQSTIYMKLAEALGKHSRLAHLKVYWWSLEMMTKFVSIVMSSTKALESLQIDDCTKKPFKNISAVTWSELQDFCQHSGNVKRFVFLNCEATAIVCHVIRHLSSTIEELDFSGCPLNLMCVSEIAAKLECSQSLRCLHLSITNMQSSDLNVLAQGIKRSNSLQELDISRTDLDNVGIVAIAESIKLSTSLTSLDLSHCELSVGMCHKLAEAIRQNRSMRTVVLANSKVSSQGRLAISHSKVNHVNLVRP